MLLFRLLFKLPRVVPDQREKFDTEDLFKKHIRETEVRYTLHRNDTVKLKVDIKIIKIINKKNAVSRG